MMNALTAVRTFAKPGYSPAKQTRIFADRYYLVSMQNTERDMGDGYYLAEGEYRELLPGDAARARRDARLNHCNRVTEWDGEVWAVLTSTYGHWDTSRKPKYAGSQAEANAYVAEARAVHEKWLVDCEKELVKYQAKYDASPTESWLAKRVHDCSRVITENQDTFKFEVLQVRK
jgi:hypothetical protein